MIYAINEKTKEHKVVKNAELSDVGEVVKGVRRGDPWRIVQADAGGWIEWSGEERPLPWGAECEVRVRDGSEYREIADADGPSWSHGWGSADIIAYRPILEEQEAGAPEWDGEGTVIGRICQIAESTNSLKISYPAGTRVKVYTSFVDDRGVELFAFVDVSGRVGGVVTAKCIEPIRTLAQRAEDEALKDMMSVASVSYVTPEALEMICRSLYRNGYRKVECEP